MQDYLRAAASRVRETARIGPFLATFARYSRDPALNYAIPDHDVEPTPPAVAALVDAYRRRGLMPRLEYLPALAPAVETSFQDAGFVVEQRLPLMVCTPATLRDPVAPADLVLRAVADEATLHDLAAVQHDAFDDPPPTRADIDDRRATIAAGAAAIVAYGAADNPAGAGVRDVSAHHVAEIAGIGVRRDFRRHGVAAAVTARLARDAFDAGLDLVFLTAAHDEGQRSYERAGFVLSSTVLSLALPPHKKARHGFH